MSSNSDNAKVSARRFYGEYHGHQIRDLQILYPRLRENCDSLLWTAGDSSLDNKYWFSDHKPAVEGVYRDVLDPPTSNADVTYWLNYLALQQRQRRRQQKSRINNGGGERLAAINTAVEATTLNERTRRLRPQDRFLRDNMQPNDVLVVSVGGNDVALAPLPCTIFSILALMKCMPITCLENGCVAASAPVSFRYYCLYANPQSCHEEG